MSLASISLHSTSRARFLVNSRAASAACLIASACRTSASKKPIIVVKPSARMMMIKAPLLGFTLIKMDKEKGGFVGKSAPVCEGR